MLLKKEDEKEEQKMGVKRGNRVKRLLDQMGNCWRRFRKNKEKNILQGGERLFLVVLLATALLSYGGGTCFFLASWMYFHLLIHGLQWALATIPYI